MMPEMITCIKRHGLRADQTLPIVILTREMPTHAITHKKVGAMLSNESSTPKNAAPISRNNVVVPTKLAPLTTSSTTLVDKLLSPTHKKSCPVRRKPTREAQILIKYDTATTTPDETKYSSRGIGNATGITIA